MKNKRKSQRKICLVPVEGKKGTGFFGSQTVDISAGGVGLISNRAIALDEKIAVEIATSQQTDPILVLGKVVWTQKLKKQDLYRVGLEFQKGFSARDRQKLNRVVSL